MIIQTITVGPMDAMHSLTMVYYSESMGASNREAVQPASVSIGSEIAVAEAAQIRELIEAGVYLKESDFVRDAIRHPYHDIVKCLNR